MQAIDIKLNMIIAENPLLIISKDRFFNHHLNRKYTDVPFHGLKMYVLNFADDFNKITFTNCRNSER